MKTYNNRHRGFVIHIEEINSDRVEYNVQKQDGSIVTDSEGFCVTVDEAMETCKDIIDGILDN